MRNCRHIREIENLPISQLTDAEITKAALYRLKASMLSLVYLDEEETMFFFTRYKNRFGRQEGKHFHEVCKIYYAGIKKLKEGSN